ncbi:binding-protein-dependent transport systems inner membrane component [Novosphingobium nitrogenifigens DSM 19370]|uniref:Binding-protein-dependent transport systems inner membrane component n=1 Tax=Novosphingobium nitrogenifigens DSM 19370 TaxID=983920 RepID=F1Z7G0_9SPHN|nr:ABC transporter permease subunit [Novosphingobium nitrogenifigens]EGD59472.1 binding-protein-dependent transport systems inner membrane component [Novosphingobium nitrogenifigens DSM 19370]
MTAPAHSLAPSADPSLPRDLAFTLPRWRLWRGGAGAAALWIGAGLFALYVPGVTPLPRTGLLGGIELAIGIAIAVVALAPWRRSEGLEQADRWLAALPIGFVIWQYATNKTGLLPLPFFPAPESVLEVFTDDWAKLAESALASLVLLIPGYAIGAALGFSLGVAIGWSRAVHYWAHPILRFVGPLPATAWLPIAFFCFPSTRSASTFLIALASGFPVAVLTSSGVASVARAYYDIARNLGADPRFLVRKVAVPAALPSVFVGLFMGLGASFVVLVTAEMIGVKAGLGFYLQWAQGWAAYANIYAALIVMAFLFSGLIGLLFAVRDRVLAWQKGIVRW